MKPLLPAEIRQLGLLPKKPQRGPCSMLRLGLRYFSYLGPLWDKWLQREWLLPLQTTLPYWFLGGRVE